MFRSRSFQAATLLLMGLFPIIAQDLKPAGTPAAPAAAPATQPATAAAPTTEFPAPGEGGGIGKMPKVEGTLAKIRAKYFYLGELTWRGGILLNKETSDWGTTRQTAIQQDIMRQASVSNSSTNQSVPLVTNSTLNYVVGIEGLLGVNLDQLPGLRSVQMLKDKKFLRVGFHAYMAPLYKSTTQTVGGPFSYYDAAATCANCSQTRTYAGSIQVDENLLNVSPGMSFFYWYERGFFERRIMPYIGVEVGLSIVYGKRKYTLLAQPYSTVESNSSVTYTLQAALQESIINDFGFRVMPAIGLQYHIASGHYLDLRIGYQIQQYSVTMNRAGSITETKTDAAGNFLLTWSENFLNNTQTAKLSQSGIVILLGYTAGLF